MSGLSQAGLGHVRLQVQWRWIEPVDLDPPVYFFNSVDALILQLHEAGLAPNLNLLGHPSWAASAACGPIDLVPLSRWRDFVQAIVERYDGDGVADAPGSPRVTRWEIGNEPDFTLAQAQGEGDYGSCFGGGDADAFGDLLRAAWLGAKAADPAAEVLFGGPAHDRFYNGPGYPAENVGPFDYAFVGDVLAHLKQQHGGEPGFPFVDAFALHVYNDYRNYWDGAAPFAPELAGKVLRFRDEQLRRAGEFDLSDHPIAITELSLPSMPADPWTLRDEAVQAHYPGRALARAAAVGVRTVTWFSAEDHRIGACDDAYGYSWLAVGLLRSQPVFDALQACEPVPEYGLDYQVSQPHEPKPVLAATDIALSELDGRTYDRQLTVPETGDVHIEAHRLLAADGDGLLVAFTDTGERLGRRTHPPLGRTLTVDAGLLPGWTGSILVRDHLGATTVLSGSQIDVPLGQAPRYIRPQAVADEVATRLGYLHIYSSDVPYLPQNEHVVSKSWSVR
jgi:hypothetical protein